MRASSTSSRSSRWEPPMSSPMPGTRQSAGGHRLAVVVLAHIEGLDLLGVVGDEHRALVHLLGEVALVLGLQVAAPVDLEVKLVVVLLQDLHRLGVGHPGEVGGGHMLQPLLQALVHKGVEEVSSRWGTCP